MGSTHSRVVKTRRSDGPGPDDANAEKKIEMSLNDAEKKLTDPFRNFDKNACVSFQIHVLSGLALLIFIALVVMGGLKMGVAPSYGMDATDVPSQFYGGLANLIIALLCIGSVVLTSVSSLFKFRLGLRIGIALLILMVVAQAILGALAGLYTEGNNESLRPAMLSVFNKSVHSAQDRTAWENIQQEHQCCGVVGPFQYFNPYRNLMNVPLSCCYQNETEQIHTQNRGHLENVRRMCIARANYFKTGCMDKAGNVFRSYGVAVVTLTLVSIALLLILAYMAIDRVDYLTALAEQEQKNNPDGPPPPTPSG